ncbi:bifunctional translation initiation inhibitor [Leptospira perolatii]|uniref:Bifunctional translation initiation inhibitor n=1 Tax=Leptospira perolatii TaxID=2023191 RepID=A0A2M9ZIU5_9LEPT|nr:RidA family protein [Leptospira perolatii]PJZ68164.1 bifunctional translation initiation inhibitor [Leptospira perolatii]PJZ71942.1 bifunctional translation initiation inhibitor [Leptospira perolatii]
MSILEKIRSKGYELPQPPKAIAAYIPASKAGQLVFTSGQLPLKDGKLMQTGILGKDLGVDDVKDSMVQATLNALAAISGVVGDVEHIKEIVKIGVYVASASTFTEQHLVANHASNLLLEIYGEAGRHARFAVGCSALPLGSPIEVEMTVLIHDKIVT